MFYFLTGRNFTTMHAIESKINSKKLNSSYELYKMNELFLSNMKFQSLTMTLINTTLKSLLYKINKENMSRHLQNVL